jgi:uncharacterized protein (TIGR02246 family)
MTFRRKILCSSLLLLGLCSGAPSDDKAPDKNAEPVKKVLASLVTAYNARDARAIAELFTPTGEFIDAEDNVFQGRDAISREFAALFEINPKNEIKLTAEDIREISPGILSVDGVATLAAAKDPEPDNIDFEALIVKQADGRWLLASIRSQGEDSVRTPHARLKQLGWLIGEWIDENEDSTMRTSTRWSDDGNFIISSFAISVAGRKVMTGTQWIGWDGSLDRFRSWVFDSEGGHAQGIWTEFDDRWIVKATGVRPEGDACSATHIYELQGPDAYVFSVTDRVIGDEAQPDFIERVVRKPPEPEKASAAVTPRSK